MRQPSWVDVEYPNEATTEDPTISEVDNKHSPSDEGEVSDHVEDSYVSHPMSSSPASSEDSSDDE